MTNTPVTAPTMPDECRAAFEDTLIYGERLDRLSGSPERYDDPETDKRWKAFQVGAAWSSREQADGAGKVKVIEGLDKALEWWDRTGGGHGPERRLILKAARAYSQLQEANQAGDGWLPTHRHVKRGTDYQVIGDAVMQCEGYEEFDNKRLILYKGEDGKYWVRAPSEFNDGRFMPLPAAPQKDNG